MRRLHALSSWPGIAQGVPQATKASVKPRFSSAVAFDTSPAMRDVARQAATAKPTSASCCTPSSPTAGS